MATETQRLIALSLGKIAASRQKRGGINLHKNLLVASVLHKARSAYMMENLQSMLAKKAQQNMEATKLGHSNQQISTQNIPISSNTTNSQSSTHNSVAGKRSRLETDYRVNTPCPEDKENAPPKCSKLENENSSDNSLSSKKMEKCEAMHNNGHVLSESQCTESKEVNDYVSSCTRCVNKRRRDHDSSQEDDSVLIIKKARLDCDEKLNEFNDESDDMQTDCAQMTSLVNVFNSSLGGLCTDHMSRTSNDDADDEADDDSSEDENDDDVFYTNLKTTKSISTFHGLGDKGHIYCGSNVVDSVTMPTAIALTV